MKKKILKNQKERRGFTIIEISLVMAFVSVLLISIALIISNMMAVYQKGLTLKSVDSVGRNLVEEFITTINSAPSIDTDNLCRTHYGEGTTLEGECKNDNAYKFIFQSHQPVGEAIQYSGVLCTGNYSYIWNTQYGINADRSLGLKYRGTDDIVQTISRPYLARFEDRNYRACTSSMLSGSYEFHSEPNYVVDITELENGQTNKIPEPEQNFLDGSEIPLLLYELTVFPVSQDSVTLRSFFSGTFILATEPKKGAGEELDASITRTDDYCRIDNVDAGVLDLGSRFNYCAINKFNFAARTAGV